MKKNIEVDFQKIFKGKKIPIVTLDERWHELFPEYDKPAHIKELETKINDLLKQQGKLSGDMKDMKKLKSNLMQEIITNMDVNENAAGKQRAKKLDRNQKLIKEISEKMKNSEDELIDLPYQIKSLNEQLIIESATVCYNRLNNNSKRISEIASWISGIREELKERLLEKQDMEMKNSAIYSYLHDIMGAGLMQELDEAIKKK
ncbi:hypothetical protein acsn021_31150 [Anaerocolumna cellulosilytica]|uniref:Uncharacterized protein n=1 Tax=Anaerocolumna cellulosilytica TaxID=433286 RepID=A0A6S6R0H0_9FIRM|nr:hypothetical protein [Anaerocolumna cellulosilytica]MBB5197905.1 uncharacterized protein YpiB (UPF0302 family) [Anaerocolumna cellulosilytica]BCJ95546.1 hypothetical protein acsn021_31150 [Anaerocolumna cellulosilytica]